MQIQRITSGLIKKATTYSSSKILSRVRKPSDAVDIFAFSTKIHKDIFHNVDKYNSMLQFFKNYPIETEIPTSLNLRRIISDIFHKPNEKIITPVQKATNDELSALYAYIHGVAGAIPMLTGSIKGSDKFNMEACKNLQNLLRKNVLSKDMVLYRGIKRGEIVYDADITFSALESGMPYKDFEKLKYYKSKGFVSTSLMPDVAYEFGDYNGIIARIYAPKNTKGAFVPELMDNIINEYRSKNLFSNNRLISEKAILGSKRIADSEKELILPVNTTFRILGHHDVDDLKIIDAIVHEQ